MLLSDEQPKLKPVSPVPGMEAIAPQPVNAQLPAPTSAPAPVPSIAPPVPAPPVSSAPPSVPTSTVSPDSNLLSTQINPSAPTATAQPSPQTDSQFQKYTQGFDTALSNISNGPNRTQLALQALSDFDTAGQPQLEAGFRRVGQVASKFGRLGSGMTTNDLTGLQATYDRNRMLLKNDLARSVAEGDINDRFRTADLYSGARGQQYGFGNADRSFNSDFEDRLFGQRRSGENDLRTERDYQTNRSDKALEDSIRERILQDTLLNSSFGRAQDRLSAGSAGNPAGAYSDFAGQLSGDAGDLMGAGAGLISGANTRQPSIDYGSLIQQLLALRGQ